MDLVHPKTSSVGNPQAKPRAKTHLNIKQVRDETNLRDGLQRQPTPQDLRPKPRQARRLQPRLPALCPPTRQKQISSPPFSTPNEKKRGKSERTQRLRENPLPRPRGPIGRLAGIDREEDLLLDAEVTRDGHEAVDGDAGREGARVRDAAEGPEGGFEG